MKSGQRTVLAVVLTVIAMAAIFGGYMIYNRQSTEPMNSGCPAGYSGTPPFCSTASQQAVQIQQASCAANPPPATTPQQTEFRVVHYASDSTISNLQLNLYTSETVNGIQELVPSSSDSPGAVSDGTTTSATADAFPAGGGFYLLATQSSGANAYPEWWMPQTSWVGAPQQLPSIPGINAYSVGCVGSANNAAVNYWLHTITMFEAPSSGTSSTTNVQALVQYPGATPTGFPTTQTTWNIILEDFQNYKAGMLPTPLCGTTTLPVTNYATGQTFYGCPQGPGQGGLPTDYGYLLIISNQTGLSVNLGTVNGQTPNGMSMFPISGNQLSSGTRAWAVQLPGSAPAPGTGVSSSSPYYFENVPINIYETVAATGHHGEIIFWFVDEQQFAYLNQYLTDPAQGGTWPTASAAGTASAGTPSGFAGLITTSGNNAGNPPNLINQADSVILTY